MTQAPTVGGIVHYSLSKSDAVSINRRRNHAEANMATIQAEQAGYVAHAGSQVEEGGVFPLVITRVWDNGSVNGQVLLDGNDQLWVTSRSEGEGPESWRWPPRA